jgi:excisionase family DNA binding protein
VASVVPYDLLTPREVAEVMRVSTMTVYRLIKSGELPAIRVGKHLRIRGADVVTFLDDRVVHSSVGTADEIGEGGSWPAD